MQENLKEILSHLSTGTDQEKLLRYLQDRLSDEEKHEVEKMMIDDSFDADAVEGLSSLKNKEKISLMVDQLNRDLQKKLDKKRRFREKLRYKDQFWIYFAVVMVLLLAVLGYFVIHLMTRAHP